MTVEEVVIAERTRFAREEGIEEGQDLANKIATIRMLKRGDSIEDIAYVLDLTIEQVLSIQKN